MHPVTTYTITGKNTGHIWQFKYRLNGVFDSWQILEGELTEQQAIWLFNPARFPYTETMCQGWRCIKNFDVVVGEPDLSFETFWSAYNYKVGKKVSTQKSWERLSKADRLAAIKGIAKYNRFLARKHGLEKAYPSTYINQRQWENEYGSAN